MGAPAAPGHAAVMRIRDWPETERPREKLRTRGARALSDAELLALFLGSGLRGHDAVSTARNLLNAHGPIRTLLDQPVDDLRKLPGIGPARSCLLAAAIELGHRHFAAGLERGEALHDPAQAGAYFARRLRHHDHEIFAALFLDTRHRPLGFEELFRGTVDGAEVYPREVARRALACNASAVIVGHNHPSGIPEPSAADRAVTVRLKQALALIDVRLLDHFIVADGPPVSMAARGRL